MPLSFLLRLHVPEFTSRLRAVLAITLAATVAVATVLAVPARAQVSSVARIHGDHRVATAVAASEHSFDSADHVVLTTSGDYPDALAATAFAAERSAPILLTDSDELPSDVADEIRRLGAGTVTVLGGENAVSSTVEDAVADLDVDVDRIAGESRYDTARQLATQVGASGGRVALALGVGSGDTPGWADALSAGSLAVTDDPVPTLLTERDRLPEATVDALRTLSPDKVLVVGGEAAVAESVERAVADLGAEVERLAGGNRYKTSVTVAERALDLGVPQDDLVFVSGENFPDALGAAAFAANEQAPMLLVPSGRLADSVDSHLRDNSERYDDGLLVGGPAAIDGFVESEIVAALRGEARPTPPPPPAPEPEPEPAAPSYKGHTFRFDLALWDRLARCESGGNWSINTGNGYYGGIQFSLASWRAVGGSGYPHQASRLEQIYRGELLQARQGWGAWPACTRKLGIR